MLVNILPNRSALYIIGEILDTTLRAGSSGISKSQLFTSVGLQTEVGEKYITQLVAAQYLQVEGESWRERTRYVVKLTPLGRNRIEWLITLSRELKDQPKSPGGH